MSGFGGRLAAREAGWKARLGRVLTRHLSSEGRKVGGGRGPARLAGGPETQVRCIKPSNRGP